MPREAGDLSPTTRWIQIRDGLKNIIEALPSAEHSAAARLQEAWATAARRVEDLQRKEAPAWTLNL